MLRFQRLYCLVLCLISGGYGCGSDSTPSTTDAITTGDAGSGTDAGLGGDASDIDPSADVPCDSTYPTYHQGMTQMAGDMTVKLLSATPAPPRQKVPNNWTMQLVNADGTPASDFTVTAPDSYMPVHMHHGRQPPKVTVDAGGNFSLSAIDFSMRGPWQVTFTVTTPNAKPSNPTFQVCVE